MKTILILGGQSKRFWPLSEKPLYPLLGKTLIAHQVERLAAAGCTDVLLVASPENRAAVAALFPHLTVIEQTRPACGMREAFLDALPLCGDGPVLLTHGNDVVDPAAYTQVLQCMTAHGCDGALLARKVSRYFPGGYLTVEGERITGIVEKPGEGSEPSDLVNIVVHAHRSASALLRALSAVQTEKDDGYEVALDGLFRSGRYMAVPYTGMWQAVKYPWHVLTLLHALLAEQHGPRIHPSAVVHPSAVIEGAVVLDEGVRVLPHATITGPAYIGKRTVVGNNSLVRQSSIGADCVVGFSTEVCRSAWHDGVWTHMTYTGDSVVGKGASFGAGCVTGNLRLDGQDVQSAAGDARLSTGLSKFGTVVGDDTKVGIRTAINPGIKIGRRCFVTGGLVIAADIPDDSFVKVATPHVEIRRNKLSN